jgi:hypothetical protein
MATVLNIYQVTAGNMFDRYDLGLWTGVSEEWVRIQVEKTKNKHLKGLSLSVEFVRTFDPETDLNLKSV